MIDTLDRAARNVGRKKARTLLVVLALGLSIAAIVSVYSGVEASTANTQNMIAGYKQHIITMGTLSDTQQRMITVSKSFGGPGGFGGVGGFERQGGYGGYSQQSQIANITQEDADNISAVENVEGIVPIISRPMGTMNIDAMRQEMRQRPPDETGGRPSGRPSGGFEMTSMFDYIIQGVPLDPVLDEKYSILPTNIVAGTKITENDASKVMVREELTVSGGYFGNSTVGSYIEIEGSYFQIAGIYSSDDNRNYVYMSLSDARKALGMAEDEVSSLDVYATTTSAVDLVVYDIQQLYPDYSVISSADMASRLTDRMNSEQAAQISALEADNAKIQNSGNQIIIISTLTAGLIVLFLMLYTVRERTKEIGLLKALGFPGSNIMVQFIIEGIMIGFIGGFIGIAIALVAGPFISEYLLPSSEVFATSTPSLTLILLALCLTAFLGAVGTIYPAWEASRKSPVEAIKHE